MSKPEFMCYIFRDAAVSKGSCLCKQEEGSEVALPTAKLQKAGGQREGKPRHAEIYADMYVKTQYSWIIQEATDM